MDQETNTPTVTTETPTPFAPENSVAHQSPKGYVYGAIIVGIILIGTVIFALSKTNTPEIAVQNQTPEAPALVADTATAELSVQGSSDDISDIEQDLNSTDLSSLDDIDNI